jgi:N-acetylglutamate synthase-like GNAT family acetyltransferase
LRYERKLDFFSFFRLEKAWRNYIVEDGGKIIGYVASLDREVLFNNEKRLLSLLSTLRIHPSFRRRGVGSQLFSTWIKDMETHTCALEVFYFLKGNKPVIRAIKKYISRYAEELKAGSYRCLKFNIYQFPAIRNYPIKGFMIREACEKDVPGIVSLLKDYYKDYNLQPLFTEDLLKEFINKSLHSFSIHDFLVAEKDGDMRACLGVWDQSPFRRMVVEKMGWTGTLVKFLLRVIRLFTKIPEIPGPDEPMRVVYFKFPAFKESEAMKYVIAEALNRCREKDYLLAVAGCDPRDGLRKIYEKFFNLKSGMEMYIGAFCTRLTLKDEDFEKTLYVDISMD